MIAIEKAFQIAPPQRPAVLCVKRGNATEMIALDWFTWLNLRTQPMISYAMKRTVNMGLDLEADDTLYLAFPAPADVEKYADGILALPEAQEEGDVRPISADNLPVMIPEGSDVVLHCTLARAYNYPFKKVRIFNCNLEAVIEPNLKK